MTVPTYDLYGDDNRQRPDYWLHCETIASRSSRNRWEIRLHRHEHFQQFLYIRSGDCDATLGTLHLPAEAPCVLVIPPGVQHGFRFSQEIDGVVITLAANRNGTGMSGTHEWMSAPRLIPLPAGEDAHYLDQTILRLLHTYEQDGTRSRMAGAYLDCALALLGYSAGSEKAVGPQGGKAARIEVLIDLISQHSHQQMTVEDYARDMKLSSTHLNRLARQATGHSVHDLILHQLIDDAQRALIFSADSVKTISEDLGFADSAYFSRWFRKIRSMTPRQYRQQMRDELARQDVPAG